MRKTNLTRRVLALFLSCTMTAGNVAAGGVLTSYAEEISNESNDHVSEAGDEMSENDDSENDGQEEHGESTDNGTDGADADSGVDSGADTSGENSSEDDSEENASETGNEDGSEEDATEEKSEESKDESKDESENTGVENGENDSIKDEPASEEKKNDSQNENSEDVDKNEDADKEPSSPEISDETSEAGEDSGNAGDSPSGTGGHTGGGSSAGTAETGVNKEVSVAYVVMPEAAAEVIGDTALTAGDDLVFSIIPKDGYVIEKVTANSTELSALEDVEIASEETEYVLEHVMEDTKVQISLAEAEVEVTEAVEVSVECDGVIITVEPVSGSWNKDIVAVEAAAVTDEAAYAAMEEEAEKKGVQYEELRLFDISLLDAEGNKIQPDENVKVTFTDSALQKEAEVSGETEEKVDVMHVKEAADGTPYVAETKKGELDVESGELSFEATHFSMYGYGRAAKMVLGENQIGVEKDGLTFTVTSDYFTTNECELEVYSSWSDNVIMSSMYRDRFETLVKNMANKALSPQEGEERRNLGYYTFRILNKKTGAYVTKIAEGIPTITISGSKVDGIKQIYACAQWDVSNRRSVDYTFSANKVNLEENGVVLNVSGMRVAYGCDATFSKELSTFMGSYNTIIYAFYGVFDETPERPDRTYREVGEASKYNLPEPNASATSANIEFVSENNVSGHGEGSGTLIITIPKGYSEEEIVIDADEVFHQATAYEKYVPGSQITCNVIIKNESDYDYQYEAGSFTFRTPDDYPYKTMMDGSASGPNRVMDSALLALVGKDGDLKDDALSLTLKKHGYNGIEELHQYYIDYFIDHNMIEDKGSEYPYSLDDVSLEDALSIITEDSVPACKETNETLKQFYNDLFYRKCLKIDGSPVADYYAPIDGREASLENKVAVAFSMILGKGGNVQQENENHLSFEMSIDFYDTKNTFEVYATNIAFDFKLLRATGDLTIRKTDSATNELITASPATFHIYRMNGEAKEYYAGGNSWTASEAEAAAITTANGVAELKNLPIGTYYIQEVQAPEGYDLASAPMTAEVKTGETTDISFMNTLTPIPGRYTIVINYYEKGTTNKLRDSEQQTYIEPNFTYDVNGNVTGISIDGWKYDSWMSMQNAPLNGVLNQNLVFNVYYTKQTSNNGGGSHGGGGGGSSSRPSGGGSVPGGPGATTIVDEGVPLASMPDENQDELVTLLEEDVPLAALPKTGHNNSNVLWLLFSGLMLGAFTITGKKKEEQ